MKVVLNIPKHFDGSLAEALEYLYERFGLTDALLSRGLEMTRPGVHYMKHNPPKKLRAYIGLADTINKLVHEDFGLKLQPSFFREYRALMDFSGDKFPLWNPTSNRTLITH